MIVNEWTDTITKAMTDFQHGKYVSWKNLESKEKFSNRIFYDKCMEAVKKASKHGYRYIWLSSDKSVSTLVYKIFEEMGISEDEYYWNYGKVTIGISRDRVIMSHSDTRSNSGAPYEVIFGKGFEEE